MPPRHRPRSDTPLARSALESYLQPAHLKASALRTSRAAFAAHAAGLLQLPQFLRPDVARRVSRFLHLEASYARVRGLYSREDHVSEAEWRAAPARDRLYQYSVPASATKDGRLSVNLAAYLRLMHALEDRPAVEWFSALTGVPLGRSHASVHAMRRGDFLAPHTDDQEERRLAWILYLTPGWRARAGGVLHLSSPTGEAWRVAPAFNSLVIFDVSAGTEHYVSRIQSLCDGRARVTIGGWLTKPGGSRVASGRMTLGSTEAT